MLRNTLLFSVSIVVVLAMSMPAAGEFVETFIVDADDATSNAQYGAVTGVSGNIAIVGSHAFSSGQGKAYLFDVTTGLQLAELPNPDHTGQDFFGYSVAIDGNTAVVGAARKPGNWTGAAYIFDITDPTAPSLTASLTNPEPNGNAYGHDVGVSGNTVVVGSRNNNKAHLYSATTGAQTGTLTAVNAPGVDFGGFVSISGNTVAVSDGDGGDGNKGTVHLFDVSNPPAPGAGEVLYTGQGGFGFGNDMNGNMAIFSSIHAGNSTGTAWLWDVTDIQNPIQGPQLTPLDDPDPNADFVNFGYSVGITDDVAIVGRRDDTAFLFDMAGNQLQKLIASDDASLPPGGGSFGIQGVSIDGNIVVVGSQFSDGLDDGGNPVSSSGAAYVFAAATIPSDLNKNGFVDFEDLTILLANWNKDVGPELGNLVDPTNSLVSFADLTVLLSEWTGPGPAGSPEAAFGTEALPEPSSLMLAVLATLGLSFYRRRRRRAF